MTEILLVKPFRPEQAARFADLAGYHVEYGNPPTREQLEKAEVILGQPRMEELDAAPKLRWVQWLAAGVDPCLARKELFLSRGIQLTNLTGAFGQSISDYDKNSKGAKAYEALANEVIRKTK